MGQQTYRRDISRIYSKQLVALGRALQRLREEEQIDILAQTTVEYLQSEFSYELLWIGLYDRLTHQLEGCGGVAPVPNAKFLNEKTNLNPGDLLEQVVIQQRPVGVPDLRVERRAGKWRQIAENLGVQGTIIVPIRYKDQCYGVILMGSKLWGISPQPDEKARLSIVLGELGAALHQREIEKQRAQIKHPHEPILKLLSELRSCLNLDESLEKVVEQTHRFLHPTHTNVYWLETQRGYFWRRTTNRQSQVSNQRQPNTESATGISVQEVRGFYQSLRADEVVAIGEALSSLKADATTRLMHQIQARSLLAAPIICQEELLGFLSVEGDEARIWQDEEKEYLRGAAQLIAFTYPLYQLEEAMEQTRLDATLTSGIAQAIYSDDDWEQALQRCAQALSKRLRVERVMILLYNDDLLQFDICYQSHDNRRRLDSPLPALDDVDAQLLKKAQEPIDIENWQEDLRLVAWRDRFLQVGVQSILLCTCGEEQKSPRKNTSAALEGLILVTHQSPRTWEPSEQELLRVVAQQIGLILHQWQLHRNNERQQHLYATLSNTLSGLQQTHKGEYLDRSALQSIASFLNAPLTALIAWSPGSATGEILATVIADRNYALNGETTIDVQNDMLVQWAFSTDALVGPFAMEDLPDTTRDWLPATIDQVWVMALHTESLYEPMGMVVVGDARDAAIPISYTSVVETIVRNFAWFRRYQTLTQKQQTHLENLECLNWYKHRSLEKVYRTVGTLLRQMNQSESSANTTFSQIRQQIGQSFQQMTPLLKQEQWELQGGQTNVPLPTLLKRALLRLQPAIKQRQIWYQVHSEGKFIVAVDPLKIELVLYELLLAATLRVPVGGRIDVWCRPVDQHWLDLSITDNGKLDPQLIQALQAENPGDWLQPSPLDHPPGLHWKVCRGILQIGGGNLFVSQLEDQRILTRAVLPLSHRE
ncbi:GAF domain-containing protein [Geitlerinema sp. PCC 9228]|uniref:GAF domain-containing protein n=1 Tax=Geitlerinema sp. PCC 9228 TaxID=111611 RepID=UPI0008F9A16D|nr:GAF domain-containing protein [Geitlerinema sp. PCC 9228]